MDAGKPLRISCVMSNTDLSKYLTTSSLNLSKPGLNDGEYRIDQYDSCFRKEELSLPAFPDPDCTKKYVSEQIFFP